MIGMLVGLTIAASTFVFWEAIPRETAARSVFDAIHWPEFAVVYKLTDWLSPHNRDAGIGYWVLIHPIYWVSVGGVGGITWSFVRRRFRRSCAVAADDPPPPPG